MDDRIVNHISYKLFERNSEEKTIVIDLDHRDTDLDTLNQVTIMIKINFEYIANTIIIFNI